MAEPFLGEIRPFSFGIVPRNWAQCQGQLLQISQWQALFSLLGTTYGGDGQRTFALPDLRGRAAASRSQTFPLGQRVGGESVTLNMSQVPGHTHPLMGSANEAKAPASAGNFLAQSSGNPYAKAPPAGTVIDLVGATIPPQGGSQPHENRQPYLAVNLCIAMVGIYPPRP